MKTNFLKSMGSVLVLIAAATGFGGESDDLKNEFRFGPSFNLNISARFRGFQAAPLPAAPAAGATVDRVYPNGYVRVDSSGNLGGQTWNWGYQNTAQADTVGGAMNFNRLAVGSEAAPSRTDDPNFGFELSYLRRLGATSAGFISLEVAFGYSRLEVTDNTTHRVSGTVTTDSYPLGGVIPPLAPYAGSFGGSGPLLNATPTRTTAAAVGTLAGSRQTEADVFNFRLGPVYTLPLCAKLNLELGGGLAVAIVDNQFSFAETLTLNGVSESRAGSGGGTDVICGPYARGGLTYELTPAWRLFAGVQYQHMTDVISQSAGGKIVDLDFGEAISATFGVSFSY